MVEELGDEAGTEMGEEILDLRDLGHAVDVDLLLLLRIIERG